jgi:uncharacterized protein
MTLDRLVDGCVPTRARSSASEFQRLDQIMPYVILARDKPDAFDLRNDTRAAHIDYLKEQDAILMAAGPFLDDQDRMVGSLLVLDVPDEGAAKTFARNDPYAKAGLFETTEIKKWRWSMKPPAKA